MVRKSHDQKYPVESPGLASWALPCLLIFSASLHAEMPPVLQNYAKGFESHLAQLIGQDPDLSRDMGVHSSQDLSPARLEFSRAFQMSRIDTSEVADAHSFSDFTHATGNYYAPYCLKNNCPMMAGFREGDAGPEFVSAGHSKAFQELKQTSLQIEQGGRFRMVPAGAMIQFPDGHAHFSLVEDPSTHEQFLMPHSSRELAQLERYLGRALARAGVFSFREIQSIVAVMKQHHDDTSGGESPRTVQASLGTSAVDPPKPVKAQPGISPSANSTNPEPVLAQGDSERAPVQKGRFAFPLSCLMALLIAVPGLFLFIRRSLY